jgi:hypothetical protein
MTERRTVMTPRQFVKAAGAVAVFVAIVLAGMLSSSRRVQAVDDDEERNESKIRIGFEITPVHLNLDDKDRDLVGLGSYLLNAEVDCNGCHSAGPATQYLPTGNPYTHNGKGKPPIINTATYLGGGRDFGKLPGSGPNAPNIISRNLTPDHTGRPEGGRTFAEFRDIMRNGTDLDHLHPNCSDTITTNCFSGPLDGDLLQVMPWPVFHNMTEHDLRAIYEYLSAIPCIAGPPAPSNLHNDCE